MVYVKMLTNRINKDICQMLSNNLISFLHGPHKIFFLFNRGKTGFNHFKRLLGFLLFILLSPVSIFAL